MDIEVRLVRQTDLSEIIVQTRLEHGVFSHILQ